MKDTIIKSVTAIICVVALCITSSVAIGNYSDAVKEAAKLAGTSVSGNGSVTEQDTQADDDYYTEDTTDAAVENTDDTSVDADADTKPEADVTTPEASDEVTTAPQTSATADPTTYTKEQIVKYYTDSMNKSYNHKKYDLKKTETIAISVDSMQPGGKGAISLVNKIVEAYAKTTEETIAFSKGVAVHDGVYRADDFGVPVNLDPKGAKSATVTKKGNDYEINIQVVPETATLEKYPVYNQQCSFPLNLGAIDLFGLTVTQADFNYSGTKLKAIVGADGYVKQAEVYMPLSGKGGGNFIGIKGAAEVSGSMLRILTFTY